MPGRGRGAEVMVETDHPANLGLALVEGMGNRGDGGIGDVTDVLLNLMEDRQQGARGALVALQQAVDHWQVQHLIRHSAFLTVTGKPGGCPVVHTTLSRGIFRPLARHPERAYSWTRCGLRRTSSGHKSQLATLPLIHLYQSDVLGSLHDHPH